MASTPDLIVCGTRVRGARGDAVSVRNGRITAIGECAQILRDRAPGTRVVETGGLICPGFHDAHFHLGITGLARLEVELHGLDAAEIAEAVTAAAATRDPGRWIIGRGYDPQVFPGEGTARAALDSAAPNHPVLIRSHDYHGAALNTSALIHTGFLPSPPEIAGGRVEFDDAGEPNGVLREMAAVHAEARSGDLSDAERCDAVAAVFPDLVRAGITAVHDMSGSRVLSILRPLDEDGRLTVPVYATVAPGDAANGELRRAGRRLQVVGLKAFLDGALGSKTALLLEPYEGEAEHVGIEVLPATLAREIVEEAAAAGLPSYLHAIGDRAVRTALDALDGVTAPDGSPLRHRVEHAQMVHADDMPRFAAQGVIASVQPIHMAEDAAIVHCHWGSRSVEAFPLRQLAQSGAAIAFGSDSPIESFDVLEGIRCAVDRTGRDGTVLHADQALDVDEALDAYTSGAAWAVSQDGELGSIAPGRRATLTVLTHDIEEHPTSLADCAIAATVIDGELAYEAGA